MAVPRLTNCSPLNTPPPPQAGNRHPFAQKAKEIPGAKENFYKLPKAPKLIYTVILWYRFVVQSPPPPKRSNTTQSKRGRCQ